MKNETNLIANINSAQNYSMELVKDKSKNPSKYTFLTNNDTATTEASTTMPPTTTTLAATTKAISVATVATNVTPRS